MVAGYAPEYRPRKLLAMLQAYVDESQSTIGDEHLVLAGYVHFATGWAEFSDVWDRQCKASPRIENFHMADAHRLTGEFAGWDRTDRDKKVRALASVIRHFGPWAVSCSVSRKRYLELVAPSAPYHFKEPYFAGFYGMVIGLARVHATLNSPMPIDLIFDNHSSEQDVLMSYGLVKSTQSPEIVAAMGNTPVFKDDELVLPLQAADMLAWHLRRKAEGTVEANHRETMDILRQANDRWHLEMTEAELAPWGQKFSQLDTSRLQTRRQWKNFRREIRSLSEQGYDALLEFSAPQGVGARVRGLLSRLFGRAR